jgi:hypothetical protein
MAIIVRIMTIKIICWMPDSLLSTFNTSFYPIYIKELWLLCIKGLWLLWLFTKEKTKVQRTELLVELTLNWWKAGSKTGNQVTEVQRLLLHSLQLPTLLLFHCIKRPLRNILHEWMNYMMMQQGPHIVPGITFYQQEISSSSLSLLLKSKGWGNI